MIAGVFRFRVESIVFSSELESFPDVEQIDGDKIRVSRDGRGRSGRV